MNAVEEALARMLARREGRVVRTRATASIAAEPHETFAMTFVRVVAEDRIQAAVFGDPRHPPSTVIVWNPMSRDAGELNPLADALHAYLRRCFDHDICPRIWLPHPPSMRLVDLLGHRYRTNQTASAELRQMGANLRAISEEHDIPGQQIVAVATELLTGHFVTGQSAVEDAHLGSLLAWFEQADLLTADQLKDEADRAALTPASNVLTADEDRRVEALRRTAKARRGAGRAHDELVDILDNAAHREWNLLVRARTVWLDQHIPTAATAEQQQASLDRLRWNSEHQTPPRREGHSLARLYRTYTDSQATADDTSLKADDRLQRSATLTGHVIVGQVTAVDQPTANHHPCHLQIRTDQRQVRARNGTKLELANTNVTGSVTAVSGQADHWLLTITVTKGVKNPPDVGAPTVWLPAAPPSLFARRAASHTAMRAADHPLVTGAPVPPDRPGPHAADILAEARALRAPQ